MAYLTSSDLGADDLFGSVVDLEQDRLVIGATRNDTACPGHDDCNAGSAYVFALSGDCATPGDCDGDEVVDLDDYVSLLYCMVGVPPYCDCADLNGNGGLDLLDYGLFQLAFSHFGA